jgi:3-methyladenine DNA glycosylase AlkD
MENLLVITDDLALPFGTLRLRAKGSDGGHNGLRNIQEVLGTQEYARLRFGVGNDFPKGHQVNYVLSPWEKEEREMQLVAMDWLNAWPNEWILASDGNELKWLLTNKSWWDSVDTIATNYLGRFGRLHPETCAELVAEWRESENNWLHRSCLLFQLKYKEQLNFELLKNLILQFKSNSNFFIQKAIGWSLRQHAKTDPNAVRQFILESNIQGLAKREASKYL